MTTTQTRQTAYDQRVHRPAGRVIHAATHVQIKGAPEGYTAMMTACGRNVGEDYSEMTDDAPITCRRCRA